MLRLKKQVNYGMTHNAPKLLVGVQPWGLKDRFACSDVAAGESLRGSRCRHKKRRVS